MEINLIGKLLTSATERLTSLRETIKAVTTGSTAAVEAGKTNEDELQGAELDEETQAQEEASSEQNVTFKSALQQALDNLKSLVGIKTAKTVQANAASNEEVPTPTSSKKVYTDKDITRMSQALYNAGKGKIGTDMNTIEKIILNTDGNHDLDAEDFKRLLTTYKNQHANSLLKDLVYEGTHGESADSSISKLLTTLSDTFDTTGMEDDAGVKTALSLLDTAQIKHLSVKAAKNAIDSLMTLDAAQLSYVIQKKGAQNILSAVNKGVLDRRRYNNLMEHLNFELTKESTKKEPVTNVPTETTETPQPTSKVPLEPMEGYKYISKIETNEKGQTIYTLINGVKVTLDSETKFVEDENVKITDDGETQFNKLIGALIEGTDDEENISVYDSEGIDIEGKAGDDKFKIVDSENVNLKDTEGNEQYDIQGSNHVNVFDAKGDDKYNTDSTTHSAGNGLDGTSLRYSNDVKIVDEEGDDSYNFRNTENINTTDVKGQDSYAANNVRGMELNDIYGDDKFNVQYATNFRVQAGEGNDQVAVDKSMSFRVEAGQGDDNVQVTESKYAQVYGEAGEDKIVFDNVQSDAEDESYIDGGAGRDNIEVTNSSFFNASGASGNDKVNIAYSKEFTAKLDSGDDEASVAYSNTFSVYGGDGKDKIEGLDVQKFNIYGEKDKDLINIYSTEKPAETPTPTETEPPIDPTETEAPPKPTTTEVDYDPTRPGIITVENPLIEEDE